MDPLTAFISAGIGAFMGSIGGGFLSSYLLERRFLTRHESNALAYAIERQRLQIEALEKTLQ